MASRSDDWLRLGRRDLDHARRARDDGDHEWACFAAHQAAEKALKAVFQARCEEAWGHAVTELVGVLVRDPDSDRLVTRAKSLDKHYIPTRCPNGFASGAPMDYDTTDDATRASTMQKRSFGTVKVFSMDQPAIRKALQHRIETRYRTDLNVVAVYLFGSFARGMAVPGSDVDLLVVVRHDSRALRDRIPDHLPGAFPIGVDVIVWTRAEFEERLERHDRMACMIVAEGEVLLERS